MSITTVFTNNRSQAVRLPADARLPEGVKKVQVPGVNYLERSASIILTGAIGV